MRRPGAWARHPCCRLAKQRCRRVVDRCRGRSPSVVTLLTAPDGYRGPSASLAPTLKRHAARGDDKHEGRQKELQHGQKVCRIAYRTDLCVRNRERSRVALMDRLLDMREAIQAIREAWHVTEPSVRRWCVFGALLGALPIGAVVALAIHHDTLAVWLTGACVAGLLLLAARWGIGTSRGRRRSPHSD